MRSLVTALLGGPVYKFLDQIFCKPGRVGAGTNWQQDNYYFGVDDPFLGLGLWTAIHDANAANGCMRVPPGYTGRRAEHVPDPESDHHFRMYAQADDAPRLLEGLLTPQLLHHPRGYDHIRALLTNSARG